MPTPSRHWFALAFLVICVAGTAPRCRADEAQFARLQRLIGQFKTDGRSQAIASQTFRRDSLILASDRDPLDVVLRRTVALLSHLRKDSGELEQLRTRCAAVDETDSQRRQQLFDKVLRLRRRIAFSNPLLNFDRMLFIKRHFLPNHRKVGNHMCDQYFGFHAIRGGGLFVLEGAFGARPTARDLLAHSVCVNGRFQGKKLPSGGFLSPDLSYDGKTILFAYTEAEPTRYVWTPKSTYHIFKVNADGSELTQLTDGPTNDFDPCWLPSGKIVFISERRGGYGRCHARPVPAFTLHAMDSDGGDIVCISPSESNEWQPSIDHNGMIVYTRWDYMDRGHSQAHHPWITTPYGSDPRALQGNFGLSMRARPFMEMDVRAIPASRKYVATAAAHHGQAYGSLIVLDPCAPDDDSMAPLKRLTPEVPFPEAECGSRTGQVYATPWPLDESFYLCVYDADANGARGPKNNFGIYLLDAFGNKELIYRDPTISCLSPIPLRARRKPLILPSVPTVSRTQTAPVGILNVYDGLKRWPPGTTIKSLRIVQVLPKSTPIHNEPRIGYGSEKGARAVLGTVPVEADGSAYFHQPVDKPVFFQVLDERGLAVQSMRSTTWVRPGQKLVCQGCHEPRLRAPHVREHLPLAFRRPPSEIKPDVDGSNPFSFPRLVQTVLDRHCVSCHKEKGDAPDLSRGNVAANPHHWSTSYINLRPYAFYFGKFEAEYDAWTPPRTTPGRFGARASKLLAVLQEEHYKVRLSDEDFHRLTLWLDCNSDFFGSYENTETQARGEIVPPTLE